MAEWLIAGGAGFIGQHLARSILSRHPADRVVSLDLIAAADMAWRVDLQPHLADGRLRLVQADVRDASQLQGLISRTDVIVNLAAVHREPGHRPQEYFATNLQGAENLCRLAQQIACREIVFTSSISVYGIHGAEVDEYTQPQPKTPYGQSKLAAEQIHQDWAARTGGRLTIIRPGVVFGPGEQGNVTRLVHEMLQRKRAIYIMPDQPKAGIYIEELIEVFHWLRDQPRANGGCQLVNGVSHEQLSFNAFGRVLQELHHFTRSPVTLPGTLLGAFSALLHPFAGPFPPGSRFHPQRLAKLLSANDIRPTALNRMGYPFAWPLERALADWLERKL